VSIFAPPAAHAQRSLVPRWLIKLGPLGLVAVAVVDSSPVPLPIPGSTDLLLLWLVSHKGNPWLLALCAIIGSLIGGGISWHIGHKGGEIALRKYVSPRLYARVVKWVEMRPILSVFLPAVLPPPMPLSPFILAAGALGVARNRFLIVFGAARILRYGFIAWLAVTYGRGIVRLWSKELEKWTVPLLAVFFTVLAAGIGLAVWKYRSNRYSRPTADRPIKTASARAD
jgi:membrane protein YqaA with SNARE-associated domain